MFFNNPYVPSDVKLSYLTTPIIHFAQSKEECQQLISQAKVTTRCFVSSSYERISEESIQEMLKDYENEKVIRIQEIPYAFYM